MKSTSEMTPTRRTIQACSKITAQQEIPMEEKVFPV
jgi:hypothetical protein